MQNFADRGIPRGRVRCERIRMMHTWPALAVAFRMSPGGVRTAADPEILEEIANPSVSRISPNPTWRPLWDVLGRPEASTDAFQDFLG